MTKKTASGRSDTLMKSPNLLTSDTIEDGAEVRHRIHYLRRAHGLTKAQANILASLIWENTP